MDLSVSPINLSNSEKEEKYERNEKDIIKSITETESNYRFINAKKKKEKTYSNYNNIKDSMVKGIRKLYVPNKKSNKIEEGSILKMIDSEKESNVKKIKGNRDIKPSRESNIEPSEIDDENTIQSHSEEDTKKSKKNKNGSESSLLSLSSNGVDTYHKQTETVSKMNMETDVKNNIINNLPEGYSGPVPHNLLQQQQYNQAPKINKIGQLLGHNPAEMGLNQMPTQTAESVFMNQMSVPQQNIPQDMGLSNMGDMSMLGQQIHPASLQPQMNNMVMPDMSQQIPSIPGIQTMTGIPSIQSMQNMSGIPQMPGISIMMGGNGENKKRKLKLKKDFFF